jgi:hypothetical protein
MSNWLDGECLQLLRNVHRACSPGGRVLVMDCLFHDDRCGPLSVAVMNLEMQVETRGRHRTAAAYVEMLAASGVAKPEVRRSRQTAAHRP